MATWIVHLRIADEFIKQNIVPDAYKYEFICGSLAPDCGYGKKDSNGEFTPPPEITHWTPDGCKIFCEYQRFYDTYLKNSKKNNSYYFYLGYYIHLITDVLWSASIYMSTKLRFREECSNNPDFINTIKKDWYGLDFLFLKNTEYFEPYTILQQIKAVNDYLPYYEKGQLTMQIRYIADYYKNELNKTYDFSFKYLTEKEMAAFIDTATELILTKL